MWENVWGKIEDAWKYFLQIIVSLCAIYNNLFKTSGFTAVLRFYVAFYS